MADSKPKKEALKPDSEDTFIDSEENLEDSELHDVEVEAKALDQLSAATGLEVEDMPESNELQERRRKTKNRLAELANVESEQPAAFEDSEEPGLMDLLREANLSGRHVKFCCSGVAAIFILVGLFFGAKAALEYWQNRPESADDSVEEEAQVTPEESEEEYDYADPSLLIGIMVGTETAQEDAAVQAGESLGDTGTAADSFTQAIVDFISLYESMQVDVNELLAQTSDRSGVLEDYTNELNFLIYQGEQQVERLDAESANLADQFEASEQEKNTGEERFFTKIKDLDAYGAAAALDAFIADAETVVRLRAEYNARQKLLSYFEQVLESAAIRLKDIELNEEALIKGIQVVDIEGSTLELIIDESDL